MSNINNWLRHRNDILETITHIRGLIVVLEVELKRADSELSLALAKHASPAPKEKDGK